jgi:hypothetical protein
MHNNSVGTIRNDAPTCFLFYFQGGQLLADAQQQRKINSAHEPHLSVTLPPHQKDGGTARHWRAALSYDENEILM